MDLAGGGAGTARTPNAPGGGAEIAKKEGSATAPRSDSNVAKLPPATIPAVKPQPQPSFQTQPQVAYQSQSQSESQPGGLNRVPAPPGSPRQSGTPPNTRIGLDSNSSNRRLVGNPRAIPSRSPAAPPPTGSSSSLAGNRPTPPPPPPPTTRPVVATATGTNPTSPEWRQGRASGFRPPTTSIPANVRQTSSYSNAPRADSQLLAAHLNDHDAGDSSGTTPPFPEKGSTSTEHPPAPQTSTSGSPEPAKSPAITASTAPKAGPTTPASKLSLQGVFSGLKSAASRVASGKIDPPSTPKATAPPSTDSPQPGPGLAGPTGAGPTGESTELNPSEPSGPTSSPASPGDSRPIEAIEKSQPDGPALSPVELAAPSGGPDGTTSQPSDSGEKPRPSDVTPNGTPDGPSNSENSSGSVSPQPATIAAPTLDKSENGSRTEPTNPQPGSATGPGQPDPASPSGLPERDPSLPVIDPPIEGQPSGPELTGQGTSPAMEVAPAQVSSPSPTSPRTEPATEDPGPPSSSQPRMDSSQTTEKASSIGLPNSIGTPMETGPEPQKPDSQHVPEPSGRVNESSGHQPGSQDAKVNAQAGLRESPPASSPANPDEWVTIPNRSKLGLDSKPNIEKSLASVAAPSASTSLSRLTHEDDPIQPVSHTVARGENFWSIARTYYGSGRYYKALWMFNRQVVDAPESLYVGAIIRVPAVESLDSTWIEPASPPRRVVETNPGQGEPVRGVVAAAQEDLSMARRIPRGAFNPPAVAAGTDSGARSEVLPDEASPLPRSTPRGRSILVGNPQQLEEPATRLPEPSAPRSAPASPPITGEYRVYTTRSGETLRSISRDILGDSSRYEELLRLNRDWLTDPYRLEAGTQVLLPSGSTRRRAR